jgi:hypothetical protein
MAKSRSNGTDEKPRGGCLTAALVFLVLHSAFAVWLIVDLRAQPYERAIPWLLPLLLVLALADLVSAIALWFWKRWGFILYGISTAVSIVVGLVVTGTQLVVFHDILPFAVLGYLLRDKWKYFGLDA